MRTRLRASRDSRPRPPDQCGRVPVASWPIARARARRRCDSRPDECRMGAAPQHPPHHPRGASRPQRSPRSVTRVQVVTSASSRSAGTRRGAARPGAHRRRDHLAGRPNRHPGMGRAGACTARARWRDPLVARPQHRHADRDRRAAATQAPAGQWMTACDQRRPDEPPTSIPSIPGGDQTPNWFSMYSLERSASSAGQPNTVRPSNSFE